ncbi:hypothetical protein C8Q73DRAFT_151128 [Cubamyces lactineus]|nr:hypothetical protein C8Q73DRAFT_151128 [Cubamyces lactineus]
MADSSDSSSGSPPRATGPEDEMLSDMLDSPMASFGKESFVSIANLKRHYPGRPLAFGGSEGAREPKARRKDTRSNAGSGPFGSNTSMWEQSSLAAARGQRDELLEQGLVDQLRNQFGDPFDDTILKKAAGTME